MRVLHALFGFLICAGISAAYAQLPAHPTPADSDRPLTPLEQQLIAAQQASAKAEAQKDAAYFERTLTDDFVRIGSNGDDTDKKDFLEDLRVSEINDIRLYEFKVVSVNDGAAVVTCNAIVSGNKGLYRPRYQHLSAIWVKQGDQWKKKFEQATPNLWSANDTD